MVRLRATQTLTSSSFEPATRSCRIIKVLKQQKVCFLITVCFPADFLANVSLRTFHISFVVAISMIQPRFTSDIRLASRDLAFASISLNFSASPTSAAQSCVPHFQSFEVDLHAEFEGIVLEN